MMDNNEFAQIPAMLQRLKEAGAQMAVFQSIEQGIADVVAMMEKAPSATDQAAVIAQAMRDAMSGIRIEPVFNVPAPTITVAAPEISLPQQVSSPPKGWNCTVTGRDDLGRLKTFTITPEN